MALTSSLPSDPEDATAEQQAAEAREQGTDLIREHLRGHLSQNPSSSYVTWIATLHPENATVTIDPRFYAPGNAWKTVYNETNHEVSCGSDDEHSEVPVDAVVVDSQDRPRSYAGFLDFIMGFMILVTAIAMTIASEMCAVALRCVARLFEGLYDTCYHYCALKYTIGWIWWIMWKSVWFCEHVFLYTSVFVTELLAGISWMLCAFFALDCQIGRAAHQRTRRTSHLVRWACRRPLASDSGSGTFPQGVHEISHKQAVMPTATVVPERNPETIQTATVVAIHDVESNK